MARPARSAPKIALRVLPRNRLLRKLLAGKSRRHSFWDALSNKAGPLASPVVPLLVYSFDACEQHPRVHFSSATEG